MGSYKLYNVDVIADSVPDSILWRSSEEGGGVGDMAKGLKITDIWSG